MPINRQLSPNYSVGGVMVGWRQKPLGVHLFFSTWPLLLSLLVPPRSEALAPFLKDEARHMAEHSSRRSPFQYVLCAATSPAVKHQDETLTYLNQGKLALCRSLSPLGCCPRHLHMLPSLHFKHQQQHHLWSNTCYCDCDNFFLSCLLIGSNSCQVTLLGICGD